MRELIREGERSFSFEFFPPKDEAGEEQLWPAISELEPYRPTFVSVTYGAGGTTRDTTVAITGRIARETSLRADGPPDLRRAHPRRARRDPRLLRRGGRPPRAGAAGRPAGGPRAPWTPTPGGFTYASELVELAARAGRFSVAVAAFPEGHPSARPRGRTRTCCGPSRTPGAEFAVTDMVFRASDYVALVDGPPPRRDIPILPGHHADPEPRARSPGWPSCPGTSCRTRCIARFDGLTEPGRRARRGHRDRDRAVRAAA